MFLNFENNWEHSFEVERDPTMQHNFAFVHQSVLFLGLNIPNVGVNEPEEWDTFVDMNFAWARTVIKDYDDRKDGSSGRIVIFSHAMPVSKNDALYDSLGDMFNEDLKSRHAVLFINGDGHYWDYEDNFRGEENFLRLQVRGEAAEDPTIVRVMATGGEQDVSEAFQYHRGEGTFAPVVAFSLVGVCIFILSGNLLKTKHKILTKSRHVAN